MSHDVHDVVIVGAGSAGYVLDWDHHTTPQVGLLGRTAAEPHGRMLGGTSSLNAMLCTRGHPADFDACAHAGAPGWSYADLLSSFRRVEDAVDDPSRTGVTTSTAPRRRCSSRPGRAGSARTPKRSSA